MLYLSVNTGLNFYKTTDKCVEVLNLIFPREIKRTPNGRETIVMNAAWGLFINRFYHFDLNTPEQYLLVPDSMPITTINVAFTEKRCKVMMASIVQMRVKGLRQEKDNETCHWVYDSNAKPHRIFSNPRFSLWLTLCCCVKYKNEDAYFKSSLKTLLATRNPASCIPG